jgi:hypothetical protein
MLLVPLLTGGILGLRSGHDLGSVALLMAACLSLFCLRTPFESLVGVSPFRVRTAAERRVAILAVSGYAVLALSCAATLMTRVSPVPLLILGNVAAIGFAGQLIIRGFRPQDRCLPCCRTPLERDGATGVGGELAFCREPDPFRAAPNSRGELRRSPAKTASRPALRLWRSIAAGRAGSRRRGGGAAMDGMPGVSAAAPTRRGVVRRTAGAAGDPAAGIHGTGACRRLRRAAGGRIGNAQPFVTAVTERR